MSDYYMEVEKLAEEASNLRDQLAEAKKDAERWKFYAGRVASRIGISMEQFTDDIDQAMREGE